MIKIRQVLLFHIRVFNDFDLKDELNNYKLKIQQQDFI